MIIVDFIIDFVVTLSGIFYFFICHHIPVMCLLFHCEGLLLAQGKCTSYDPLGLCMSENVLISPSFLKHSFSRDRILGWQVFSLYFCMKYIILLSPYLWVMMRSQSLIFFRTLVLDELVPSSAFKIVYKFDSNVSVWV